MKLFSKKDRRTELDKEIETLIENMKPIDPSCEAYTAMAENLKTLYEARATEKSAKADHTILNTLLVLGGNLLVVLVTVGYEYAHPAVSKAWGMLIKRKID